MGKSTISLFSMLLLVAVACLAISHFQTSRRLVESQAELRRLRDEVGYLSVDDDTKINVVAIETGERDTWQWRMFLPKGSRYEWNIACDAIVFNSPHPQPMKGVSNQPYWESDNTVLVTARLRDVDEKTCSLSVTSKIGDSNNQMAGAALHFSKEKKPLAVRMQGEVLGSNGTATLDPGAPIFLVQRRVLPEPDPVSQRIDNSQATPGFMIWMSKW